MPTSGVFNGRIMNVYVGSDAVGCATESSLSLNRATIDATCKDSNSWGDFLAGQMDWSVSSSSLLALDESAESAEDFFDALIAGTNLTVKLSTGVAGDWYLSGTSIVTSFEISAPDNDVVTYSVTLTGKGALAKATEA